MYQSTFSCPHCGHPNLRGTWVCAQCGITLLIYCPNCRAGNEAGSQFCYACGTAFIQAGQYPPSQGAYGAGQYQYGQPPAQRYPDAYGQPPYTGQPPDYSAYGDYGQQPPQAYSGQGNWQDQLQSFQERIVNLYRSVNPVLLLALGTVIVCLVIFVLVAFQFGWIKTGVSAPKIPAVTDKTPPQITLVQVKPGNNRGAIISWVTDEYSSSQIRYGIWPNINTVTPIENDPTTGINMGVLIHEVGIPTLIPKTTYIYRVVSIDKYGNRAESPDLQFQTAPQ